MGVNDLTFALVESSCSSVEVCLTPNSAKHMPSTRSGVQYTTSAVEVLVSSFRAFLRNNKTQGSALTQLESAATHLSTFLNEQ